MLKSSRLKDINCKTSIRAQEDLFINLWNKSDKWIKKIIFCFPLKWFKIDRIFSFTEIFSINRFRALPQVLSPWPIGPFPTSIQTILHFSSWTLQLVCSSFLGFSGLECSFLPLVIFHQFTLAPFSHSSFYVLSLLRLFTSWFT